MINDYHRFMSVDEKKKSYFKHYDFLKSEFPNHSQYEIEKALAIDGVDIRIFGKPESFKKRRMGVILSTGENIDEAKKKPGKVKVVFNHF